MAKKPEDGDILSEKIPDRPLECSECRKQIAVIYTEMTENSVNQTCMCADCPELEKRLHGSDKNNTARDGIDKGGGLACGNCGTNLDAVRTGSLLGCCDCYDVFEDVIVQELLSSKKTPFLLGSGKKFSPVHIGRSPGETPEMTVSLRLLALNEALTETLKKEDYEQAAWLRDQIKALTEHKENQHGE